MTAHPSEPIPAAAVPTVREVQCKSALVPSAICDYALNCYTGCQHACLYCYARFMGRFHHPGCSWGSFVDVKINAPDVLQRQLNRRRVYPGTVFVSSVCDGWQPLEQRYQVTQRCLEPLLAEGFELHVLTKSHLVTRDLDVLARSDRTLLGVTITTLDETLRRQVEPHASPAARRLAALHEAARRGIRIFAFFGPLLPGLTDTVENINALFSAVADLPLDHLYVDRLNLRWGVWPALKRWLQKHPHLAEPFRAALFDHAGRAHYERQLQFRVRRAAQATGLTDRLRGCC
jgi:DNA repair photolyase